jgi:signal transduction histidine kinase
MTAPTRAPWVLPTAVLVAGGTAGANGAGDGTARDQVIPAAVIAILAMLTLLLRRWPAVTIGGSAGLAAAYFALDYADGPIYLVVPLAVFVVANDRRPREWWPWAAAAVILFAIVQVVRGVTGDEVLHESVWQALGEAAFTAAAGAIGTSLRTRREARAERVQRTATEERLRMAQDLHDGVGHGLAVIAMQAGAALHVLDQDPAQARRNLEAIRAASKESLDALRAELARMSGDPGEPGARRPTPALDDLDGLLDRVRGGGLVVERSGSADGVDDAVSRTAYAVVQEALTNVLRHANATKALVSFERRDDGLVVTVRDDGRGGVPNGQDGGMGISGMRSRVEALGGSLEAGPGPSGFRVRAVLPAGR